MAESPLQTPVYFTATQQRSGKTFADQVRGGPPGAWASHGRTAASGEAGYCREIPFPPANALQVRFEDSKPVSGQPPGWLPHSDSEVSIVVRRRHRNHGR